MTKNRGGPLRGRPCFLSFSSCLRAFVVSPPLLHQPEPLHVRVREGLNLRDLDLAVIAAEQVPKPAPKDPGMPLRRRS